MQIQISLIARSSSQVLGSSGALLWPVWFALDARALPELLTGVPAGSNWMHSPGPVPLTHGGRGTRLEWASRLQPGVLGDGAVVGFAAVVTRASDQANKSAWAAYRELAARVRAAALRRGREAVGLGDVQLLRALATGHDDAEDLDAMVRGVRLQDPAELRDVQKRAAAQAELVAMLFPDRQMGPTQATLGGATPGRTTSGGVTSTGGAPRLERPSRPVLSTGLDLNIRPERRPFTRLTASPAPTLNVAVGSNAGSDGRGQVIGSTVRYWRSGDLGRGRTTRLRVHVGRGAHLVQLGGGLAVRGEVVGRPHVSGSVIAARDEDGRLQVWTQLDQPPKTLRSRTPPAAGEPAVWTLGRERFLAYRDAEGAVHVLRAKNDRWAPVPTKGPKAAGDPIGWSEGRLNNVVYNGTDGQLHAIVGAASKWRSSPLLDGLSAQGQPHAYTSADGVAVVFRGPKGGVFVAQHDRSGRWSATRLPIAVRAAGDPTGAFWPADPTHHVVYRGVDGRLHEVWRRERAGRWRATSLSNKAASARPAGEPRAVAAPDGALHVIYRGVDGNLHDLSLRRDEGWMHSDITRLTGVAGGSDPSLSVTKAGLQLAVDDGTGAIWVVTLDRFGHYSSTSLWGTR